MAELYPISPRTVQLLKDGPTEGNTHLWIASVAAGVARVLSPDATFDFLRQACDLTVTHRPVPDREIQAAVALAFSARSDSVAPRLPSLKWPEPRPDLVRRVLEAAEPLFEMPPPGAATGIEVAQAIPLLFTPDELVCVGRDQRHAAVITADQIAAVAHLYQFIVASPLRGEAAQTSSGSWSARCQANVARRRFAVVEFDHASHGEQVRLLSALTLLAPLVMVVDSAGKSLHGWFHVEAMPLREQLQFYYRAVALGADPTRWDIAGWVRMPGGSRPQPQGEALGQRILYLKDNRHDD